MTPFTRVARIPESQSQRGKVELFFDPTISALVTQDGDVIANVVNVEISYDIHGSHARVEFASIVVQPVPVVPAEAVESAVSGLQSLEQRLTRDDRD